MTESLLIQPLDPALPMHRHDYASVVVILSGQVTETDILGTRDYARADFILRPPYYLHANESIRSGTRYLRLPVSGDAWRATIAELGWRAARGRCNVAAVDVGELMADPFGGDRVLRVAAASNSFARAVPGVTDPGVRSLADDFRDSDRDDVRLDARAEAMGLRPWQLTRRFRRTFGLAPRDYRREARLQRSLHALAATDDSLKSIAASCGYADQSHFSREVARATGASPARVRRRLAGG